MPPYAEVQSRMDNTLIIRNMNGKDLSAVLYIQGECYTEIEPESKGSLHSKLLASPSTCFVASVGSEMVGYLISLPWIFAAPPMLNAPACEMPAFPDCLYLHDLAIAPPARKTGAGQALVKKFLSRLQELNFDRAALIAVQASANYWRRHGFRSVKTTDSLREKLSSYGESVDYMEYLAGNV